MEIEFKNDSGEATGRKLYLTLKSGDWHVRSRQRDETETFPINDERHARYWLKRATAATQDGQPPKQIEFRGERFDVMSVRNWRDRILASAAGTS